MPEWIIPCALGHDLAGLQAESKSVLDIKNHITFFSLFSTSFVILVAYPLLTLTLQRVQKKPPSVPEIRLYGICVKTLLKSHMPQAVQYSTTTNKHNLNE